MYGIFLDIAQLNSVDSSPLPMLTYGGIAIAVIFTLTHFIQSLADAGQKVLKSIIDLIDTINKDE